MSASERQRRYRERRKAGRLVLRVEVDEVALAAALEDLKFLPPLCDDQADIERAVAELLRMLSNTTGDA